MEEEAFEPGLEGFIGVRLKVKAEVDVAAEDMPGR